MGSKVQTQHTGVLEFQGCLQPEKFLDWAIAVEVLDFSEVLDDQRVSLVATKFWGKVAARWQQPKQTKVQQEKARINGGGRETVEIHESHIFFFQMFC